MTKKQAVFGIVKFEIRDENTLWVDGYVYSTITVGDTLYACADEGKPDFDFEVAEIIHYSRNLSQIERGQTVRLVLTGNPKASEKLDLFDELFDLPEVS